MLTVSLQEGDVQEDDEMNFESPVALFNFLKNVFAQLAESDK